MPPPPFFFLFRKENRSEVKLRCRGEDTPTGSVLWGREREVPKTTDGWSGHMVVYQWREETWMDDVVGEERERNPWRCSFPCAFPCTKSCL